MRNKGRIILICLIGFWLIFITISEPDHPAPFDIGKYVLTGLISIFVMLFIWSLYRDSKKFISSKKITGYFPTLLCTAFVSAHLILFYFLGQRDNSPIVLSGKITANFYDNRPLGFGYYIDLRADKTYKLEITQLFSEDYYRGSYKMINGIIELDKSVRDSILISSRFVIKTNFNNSGEARMYQLDDQGNILEYKDAFTLKAAAK
jgi:hypothetical protein